MKVIKFIKEKGLDRLTEQYGIKVNKYDDRIVLNYTQIDSPKTGDIVKECRGLILSWPGLDVLCRSFDRFYNYGEAGTSKFDFSKSIVYEKLDGTLVNLYYDGKKWNYATRQMAFAEGNIGFGDMTFDEAIKEILPIQDIAHLPKNQTYIFEFTSPKNRIVTKYNTHTMTLLSIRNTLTGEEVSIGEVDFVASTLPEVNRPKVYRLINYNMIMEAIRKLPKLEEGYVCFDPTTATRVKIKNPSYLAIAHIRQDGNLSEKRVIHLIVERGDSEYLEDFPEDYPFFEPYRQKYIQMLYDVIRLQEQTKNIGNQKEFALIVKDTPVAGILFQMKKGTSFNDALNSMTKQAKERLIESY